MKQSVAITFVKEAIQELKKVTWPTRMAVLRMTIGVMIISALFAIFIGIVDVGLSKGIESMLAWIGQLQQQSQQQQGNQTSPIQVQPGDIQVETNANTAS